jgi:hypothetical protein
MESQVGRFNPPLKKTTIEFLVWVHTLPKDLCEPLPPERAYLRETSELYQFVVNSRLLWRVWMIDEWARFWICVDRMSADERPEFHTMVIDEGTFDRIECDAYEIEDERASGDVEH